MSSSLPSSTLRPSPEEYDDRPGIRWWWFPVLAIGVPVAIVIGLVVVGAIGLLFGVHSFGPGWGFVWFFPWPFFLFFFVIFAVFRFGWWGGWGYYRYPRGYYGRDPREIVRERYARGEISREQLESMLRDLDQHR